jgi:MFS family permease
MIASTNPEHRWLLPLCAGRVALSLIFTAYSAVLPTVTTTWGMTGAQAGSIQSAWQVGYLISLFAAGLLADRFGAKKTLVAMSASSAAASLAFAVFSRGYASALLLYGAAGLCSGGTYTPGLKLVFERSSPGSRGTAMGLFLAASSIGYALALASAAWVIPAAGWRAALLVCAGASAVGALTLAFGLRGIADTPANVTRPGQARGCGAVFRSRAAAACILAYTFHCWELLGMWAWLPSFAVHSRGGTGAKAVTSGLVVVAASHLVSSLGSVAGGRLSDAFGRSSVMLWMSAGSLLFSFTVGWSAGGPATQVIAMLIAYNLFAIADSAVYSTALAEVVPPERLGAAYSVRSVLGFGAGALSPWVFGSVLDLSRAGAVANQTAWGLAWTSLALGALPGIPLILWFRKLTTASGRATPPDGVVGK